MLRGGLVARSEVKGGAAGLAAPDHGTPAKNSMGEAREARRAKVITITITFTFTFTFTFFFFFFIRSFFTLHSSLFTFSRDSKLETRNDVHVQCVQ